MVLMGAEEEDNACLIINTSHFADPIDRLLTGLLGSCLAVRILMVNVLPETCHYALLTKNASIHHQNGYVSHNEGKCNVLFLN